MARSHAYRLQTIWQGNRGTGTADYRAYSRDYVIRFVASPADQTTKPDLAGSADPAFLGDATRYNPEDLLLASLSACHMLWYLHLCADAGVLVTDYRDEAEAQMQLDTRGSGRFTEATLRPFVRITDENMSVHAEELHARASEMCFIRNSVNFPVHHEPTILTGAQP